VLAALDQVLSQPLSIVDLDQYEAPSSGNLQLPALGPPLPTPMPASAPQAKPAPQPKPAPQAQPVPAPSPAAAPLPDVTIQEVRPRPRTPPPSSLPVERAAPTPDNAGDLSVLSSMRVFTDLIVARETGLLRFQSEPVTKDIYLVEGTPQSLHSNQAADRFGEYLAARGFVRPADLERAQAQLPRFGGKLAEALVGAGAMKALDVARLQAQHVRERVMEIFTWTEGVFSFFRGQRNPVQAQPLGLDSAEILGAGVLTLSLEFLQSRFALISEFHPHAASPPRIPLDGFRLGSKPRELWSLLDGRRTVRQLLTRYPAPSESLTFMRVLYLLIETDLARLE
jgi:hypothetical protein